ncbi:MAG: glycosyltransferase [Chitinophagaceae bacterium]
MGKKIFFTVTNDLVHDQRMQRICGSLAAAGYEITLVGRKRPSSLPIPVGGAYSCRRFRCWFNRGKLFYFEYNLRLVFWLLGQRMDAICAIDLDTIIPCYFISRVKKIPRIYDAHELFSELKEVVTRPGIKRIWTRVERRYVPKFSNGYTVSDSIADEFQRRYGVGYQTIRNVPVLREIPSVSPGERFILYQGAVNEGRGFEFLIPAMKRVECKLVVCGDGNFMEKLRELVRVHGLENRVELRGMVSPDKLREISAFAYAAVAIAENTGLNQYLALPNKFFDYIHSGLPQVTMDYPEYRNLNGLFEVALLIGDTDPVTISGALNKLLGDDVLYERLRANCHRARRLLNWQEEEKKLISYYKSILGT